MQEKLLHYKELQAQIAQLQAEAEAITDELKAHVADFGEVAGYGVRAYMKAGRKSTDHEAAAKDHDVPAEVVEKHTVIKSTVSWAKVTKELKIDTAPYTKEGAPTFVIELA